MGDGGGVRLQFAKPHARLDVHVLGMLKHRPGRAVLASRIGDVKLSHPSVSGVDPSGEHDGSGLIVSGGGIAGWYFNECIWLFGTRL